MKFIFLKNIYLPDLISMVCNSVPSEPEINPLVRLCIRLSLGYLRLKEHSGYHIREHNFATDQELEDLAADSVADLFRRSSTGHYIRLQQYFTPRLNNCQTNEDCFLLLRKLVMSRTDQALFRIFRNRDPEGAKLIRSIKLAVDKNPDMELKETVRGTVLIYCSLNTSPEADRLPDYFEQAGLFAEIKNLFKPKDTVPELLQKIGGILGGFSYSWSGIALRDVVHLIRTFRQPFKHNRSSITYPEAELLLQKKDLQENIKSILSELYLKIEQDYVRKQKITAKNATAIKNALHLIAEDMLDGGVDRSNFEYIQHVLPDISKHQYHSELRTRFEYVVKLLKKNLKSLLFSDS
ncbi:MAG: hypothetical protein R6V04_04470 [bacterium]